MTQEEKPTTLGEMAEMLRVLIDSLGPETPVEFAVCDGTGLLIHDNVDIGPYQRFSGESGEAAGAFVMLRAHHHPGTSPGRRLTSPTADLDEELRGLIEGDA
ncbi:hypothetical protein [Actinomadura atramentaria]|uniref:hypothetical protein n=1 Tax=Actinomadura atramentaria TaxID=1990 RepID=UPI000379CFEE|nr:hypothetical protein [Actinomadura atramentaria]